MWSGRRKTGSYTAKPHPALRRIGAVTRQELAAVLSRYAAFRGPAVSRRRDMLPGRMPASIAPWALDAARSLAEAGVLPLKNGAFQPRGTVARADWAGIFARLP